MCLMHSKDNTKLSKHKHLFIFFQNLTYIKKPIYKEGQFLDYSYAIYFTLADICISLMQYKGTKNPQKNQIFWGKKSPFHRFFLCKIRKVLIPPYQAVDGFFSYLWNFFYLHSFRHQCPVKDYIKLLVHISNSGFSFFKCFTLVPIFNAEVFKPSFRINP